jgi:ABC-2 type transport system ATP-binding protein
MSSSTASLVEVCDVSLNVENTFLLNNISFEIEDGERFILLGASGAGKSLLIDVLANNIPYSGSVKYRKSLRPESKTFSYDTFAALSLLKVDEVLNLIEQMYGCPRNRDLIERFRIDTILSKPIRVLSKGERKRIGVYAALFSSPEFAVFDEPTDGMDPILRDAFWDVVRQRRGATFLTTHIWEEAEKCHDRVALIANGRLLADPAPASKLIRLFPFIGKVVVPEEAIIEVDQKFIVNDKRRFIYYTNEAEKSILVNKIVEAENHGYSVLPLDLVDAYLLLMDHQTSRHVT